MADKQAPTSNKTDPGGPIGTPVGPKGVAKPGPDTKPANAPRVDKG